VITQDIKTDYTAYDKIICISHRLRTDIELLYPKLKDKLEVIYIPFDMEKIRRQANEKNLLSPLDQELLNDNYFVVVTRLSRDKDLDTVIQAYRLFLKDTFSSTKLYFIGDGNDGKRLKQMAHDCGLSEMILFLGSKNEPYAFIKNSKASILSSNEEGAPLVIVEGMILKTIVVASNCPTAPRELLNDGKCGILFEPGNVHELKNIMVKIDDHSITNEHFSGHIDKWIGRFAAPHIIKKIEALLKQI
jgi:glycosyltransferase involved in cell wall biosynthesis